MCHCSRVDIYFAACFWYIGLKWMYMYTLNYVHILVTVFSDYIGNQHPCTAKLDKTSPSMKHWPIDIHVYTLDSGFLYVLHHQVVEYLSFNSLYVTSMEGKS